MFTRRASFRERIGASGFAGHVHFHYDCGDAVQKLDPATLLAAPAPDAHLYVCGPQGFIDHVPGTAEAQGWPAAQLHVEYFGTAAADTSGDRAFDVTLASTGRVVTVAADRTVIAALAEHGVDIPYSCEQGVCATCPTRVLDGVPDHRDLYLTAEEQAAKDQFTPCCSRARTSVLVLDLQSKALIVRSVVPRAAATFLFSHPSASNAAISRSRLLGRASRRVRACASDLPPAMLPDMIRHMEQDHLTTAEIGWLAAATSGRSC